MLMVFLMVFWYFRLYFWGILVVFMGGVSVGLNMMLKGVLKRYFMGFNGVEYVLIQ